MSDDDEEIRAAQVLKKTKTGQVTQAGDYRLQGRGIDAY